MGICAGCGNDYANTFQIVVNDTSYDFDCFECAISKLAPVCQNCACKILGHGIESEKFLYCCSHCVRCAENCSNKKTYHPTSFS